jgi:hypothetical protein
MNITIQGNVQNSLIGTLFPKQLLSFGNFVGLSEASSVKWEPSQNWISIDTLFLDNVKVKLSVTSPKDFLFSAIEV